MIIGWTSLIFNKPNTTHFNKILITTWATNKQATNTPITDEDMQIANKHEKYSTSPTTYQANAFLFWFLLFFANKQTNRKNKL